MRTRTRREHYVERAIFQLLSLERKAGSSAKDIRAMVDRCLAQVEGVAKNNRTARGLDIHRLGSVLRAWHKETKYLTFDGLPRPLAFDGKDSLKSLIQGFYPASKFRVVFDRLVQAKLISATDTGEWLPSSWTARIALQTSHETIEHMAEGVSHYVETVTNNVTAKSEQDVLFERSSKVTRLPIGEYENFRRYTGQQALALLAAVDDWLESRNSPVDKPAEQVCTAGIYAFAYVAKNPS